MNSVISIPKLRTEHLDRQALIYIRQSTPMQVQANTGSTTRQYQLIERAQALGWPPARITVIDQDQGHSGASSAARSGFEKLIAEVGLGRAGAVFSLEASRLARSCSDWYRLLEICALTDTLVIDEDGLYDPGQYNDRLLLGFRGTMSEAELHWLHTRLLGGKLAKAERGELHFRLPVGFVHDPAQRIVFDPDEEIQEAVRLVFTLFEHLGSALAVVKHFAVHRLCFPTRLQHHHTDDEVIWSSLSLKRALDVLHSPVYAGAYVYGRTRTCRQALPGEASRRQGGTRRVPPADWPIVHRDHHPGYITWEQFLRHQQQLDDNRTVDDPHRRGAVRAGQALLQGIVLCGRCGRRMSVHYRKGDVPGYECNQVRTRFAGKTCQSLRGDRIDQAVANALLEAMTPAQLEISLAAFETLEAQARLIEQQWQRRLERACFEAELARRRYLAVEPEHRLVARTLEQEWNTRLAAVEQLEQDYAALPATQVLPLSEQERQQILALIQDLPALWQASTTTQTERKQLLRLLIKEVTLTRDLDTIRIEVRWQTQACSTLTLGGPKRSYEQWRTTPRVIEQVRGLAAQQTDDEIATVLNTQGWRPGKSEAFTGRKVKWIRRAYGIASGCPKAPGACPTGQRGEGRYSAKAVAQRLNVAVSTISKWCRAGRLESIQMAPRGPRWIVLTPAIIARLRRT